MKRTLVVALAILALSPLTLVQAQTGTNSTTVAKTEKARGEVAERRLEQLKKELTLTDAQTAQVKPLLEEERAELQKIRQDATLEKKAKMEKAKAVNQQYREKINALLTPEQQKIYAANAEKAKERLSKRAEKS